jgi:tRNA threonylcarbamoyladenosine modification (KEOPS) complex Cgi121 subunit
MKILLIVCVLFLSACAETIHIKGIKLVGMNCEAVEVRSSALMTLGAMACVTPSGEVTNLVGGAGKPWIEVPLQAAGMATTVGTAIAVGQALKQVQAGTTITLPGGE